MPATEQPATRVYLDYAATAPLDERLIALVSEVSWANASSLHSEGHEAARQLDDARTRLSRALGAAAPHELTFTSGGSESDNMAVRGLARPVPGAKRTHVVVSTIEHDAVLNAARPLKAAGFAVDKLGCTSAGVVEPDALEQLLAKTESAGDATCLVCVMAVNNELGTIQPVRALAQVAHDHGALFFTDAVQALGKIAIDLEESGVDAASFSAHKVGGFKGAGALYLRRGTKCAPLVLGGGQEAGKRSGTSNVLGAVAFAAAAEYAQAEREELWTRVAGYRARVIDALSPGEFRHALQPTLDDGVAPCAPHILSLVADGLEGETLVLRCDNEGIAVSSGSACSTGSLDPSHVLVALGLSKSPAFGSLRLSFGRLTTDEHIDRFIEALPRVLR